MVFFFFCRRKQFFIISSYYVKKMAKACFGRFSSRTSFQLWDDNISLNFSIFVSFITLVLVFFSLRFLASIFSPNKSYVGQRSDKDSKKMPDLEFSWIFCAKMWSINVAVDWVILEGLEITGSKLWSSKVSKYLEVSTCISVFKRSILKSPTRISSHSFRFVSSLDPRNKFQGYHRVPGPLYIESLLKIRLQFL